MEPQEFTVIHEETANGSKIDIPIIVGTIKYIRTIGKGSYGIVYEGHCTKRNQNFACKIVSRENLLKGGNLSSFEREVRAHEQIHHPNIIEIHEVLYHPDVIVLVMDLCKSGDLLHFIISRQYPQICLVRQMFFQIVEALDYLHQRGISHRDLKPENILLDDSYDVKLADFGCAQLGIGNRSDECGTLFYAAPEILTSTPCDSRKSDIWSLGIVLFAMASKQLPWPSEDDDEIRKFIINGRLLFPPNFPEEVRHVVLQCTKYDPDERPSAQQILDCNWLKFEKQKVEKNRKALQNHIPQIPSDKNQVKRPLIIRPQSSLQQLMLKQPNYVIPGLKKSSIPNLQKRRISEASSFSKPYVRQFQFMKHISEDQI